MQLLIESIDAVSARVFTEDSVEYELQDAFSFEVPNAFWAKRNRKGWDGMIRLYNRRTKTIPTGLVKKVEAWAQKQGYDVKIGPGVLTETDFSLDEAKQFVSDLNLKFEPYPLQIAAFVHAVRRRRCLLLSPTGSGKSLILYMLAKFYEGLPTMLVVPNLGLQDQMVRDLEEYGWGSSPLHRVGGGSYPDPSKGLNVGTWQTFVKTDPDILSQFEVLLGDEVHGFEAKSLRKITDSLPRAEYRVGVTGSLKDSLTHELVLEGQFGPVKTVAKTRELQKKGILSPLKIQVLVLNHPTTCPVPKDYRGEIETVMASVPRSKFITNLAASLKGNSLILFQEVKNHGNLLEPMLKAKLGEHRVHYVHGGVSGEERTDIRQLLENSEDNVLVASYGTFSEGMNVKNLHNVVFASPFKSKIRLLQSIGRGLRVLEGKNRCTLFDVADAFGRGREYGMDHLQERLEVYAREGFDFEVHRIDLGS